MIIKQYYNNVYNTDIKLYKYYSDKQLQIREVGTNDNYNCIIDLDTVCDNYEETAFLRTDLEEEVI